MGSGSRCSMGWRPSYRSIHQARALDRYQLESSFAEEGRKRKELLAHLLNPAYQPCAAGLSAPCWICCAYLGCRSSRRAGCTLTKWARGLTFRAPGEGAGAFPFVLGIAVESDILGMGNRIKARQGSDGWVEGSYTSPTR